MLRYPSTRVGLTLADVEDHGRRRAAARHRSRPRQTYQLRHDHQHRKDTNHTALLIRQHAANPHQERVDTQSIQHAVRGRQPHRRGTPFPSLLQPTTSLSSSERTESSSRNSVSGIDDSRDDVELPVRGTKLRSDGHLHEAIRTRLSGVSLTESLVARDDADFDGRSSLLVSAALRQADNDWLDSSREERSLSNLITETLKGTCRTSQRATSETETLTRNRLDPQPDQVSAEESSLQEVEAAISRTHDACMPATQRSAHLGQLSRPHQLHSTRFSALRGSPIGHADSPSASAGNPKVNMTPKLPVYDDAKSSMIQPQTPADLVRSPSQKTMDTPGGEGIQSPTRGFPGRLLINEHHLPMSPLHRSPSATTSMHSHMQHDIRIGARAHTRMSSVEGENEDDEELPERQQDRRVWLARRANGGLDVTPPREGRFERFLD